MRAETYLNAYILTRDRLSFYQAQQGGDYYIRRNKAFRQSQKFEAKLRWYIRMHLYTLKNVKPFVNDMVSIASSARGVIADINYLLEEK